MINEKFIDIKNQRSILESLLVNLKKKTQYDSAFDKTRYCICNSDGMFNGRYDYNNDRILIDKWFFYDSLCCNEISEIKNILIHEEAHRQNRFNEGYTTKQDHSSNWLKIYLGLEGRIPKVYIKNKRYEYEKGYSEVKKEDLNNIIILGYENSENAVETFKAAMKMKLSFMYVDSERKVHYY